jgi:hypothetical protein
MIFDHLYFMTRIRKIYKKKIIISGILVYAAYSDTIRRHNRRMLIIDLLKAPFCRDNSE